jgi:hypothetical protein
MLSGLIMICGSIPAALFLWSGIKKLLRFKKILNSNPYFTYARVFVCREPGMQKRIVYCYIDYKGNKHRKMLSPFNLLQQKITQGVNKYPVAYDEYNNSVLLYNCRLIED